MDPGCARAPRELLLALDDFERCLAWAFIERAVPPQQGTPGLPVDASAARGAPPRGQARRHALRARSVR